MVNESYIRKIVENNSRADGRAFDEFRQIQIETNFVSSAEGSAKVTIGNTVIMIGIKAEVFEPYPDTPDEGTLIVDTELIPLASPEFEPGRPGEDAIEIARVIDRGIRESESIELEKLCIKAGEKIWCVHIDVHTLDHDGNMLDAAGLGAIAALLTAKLPKYDIEGKKILYDTPDAEKEKVPMKDIPIPITIIKIKDKLLIDPTLEEEEAMDARITITTNKAGDLCAIQKGGEGFFTIEEIKKAVELSIAKGKELRALVEEAVKTC